MKNNRSSVITWGVIIGLLLFSALLTALWPQISGRLSGLDIAPGLTSGERSVPPPVQEESIHLDSLPIPLPAALQDVVLSPLMVMGILAALVIGSVLVVGGGLAFTYAMLDRQAVSLKEDEAFRQTAATIEKKEKERLKKIQQEQPANPIPEHNRPRWSAVSTSLIIILFAIYIGHALARTFAPGILPDPATVRLVVWSLVIVAAFFSLLAFRPQSLQQLESSEDLSIPWGIIWVIVTGAIVVGLGSGIVMILAAG